MTENNPVVPVLTEWQSTVACFFRAMVPALFLQSTEETRVIDQLSTVTKYLGLSKCGKRKLLLWSQCSFKEIVCFMDKDTKAGETVKRLEWQEFMRTVETFATCEEKNPNRHSAAMLVIADPEHILSNPQNVRCLKEAFEEIRGSRKTIVLVGRPMQLPKELQADVPVISFDLPNEHELHHVISQLAAKYPKAKGYESVTIDLEQTKPFARACAGVTEQEARTLLGLSLAKFSAFDDRAVQLALKEKERIVKRSEVLECQTVVGSLDKVGGLENVKDWINKVTPILDNPDAAREYGLDLPSGLLLTGLPGGGKTLVAKMLAAHWKLPLLRFDVGRSFGSLLGQTEGNVREVLAVAVASAPCILFIDECEKSLGGGGETDGGASSRVKATLLTFLEEKPDNVFVIATANDLTRLNHMPELIQRFSNVFFVDLPALEARAEILDIHLKPKGHSLSRAELMLVARELKGYSGREIRNVVRAALATAFGAGAPHPCAADLLAACKTIVPTSETMREAIKNMRNWCKEGRAVQASAETIENEDSAGALPGRAEFGVPDLIN